VHHSLGSNLQNYEIEKLGFPHKTLGQGVWHLDGYIEKEVAVPAAAPIAVSVAASIAVSVATLVSVSVAVRIAVPLDQ
jgi:hypothetical protein